jgi:hypothetical protein
MSNNKKNKGRKTRTGRRNSQMNYDGTKGTQVKTQTRSNKTNRACCKDSFCKDLKNLTMLGELERYWIGRNLQVIHGSIINRLPERFVEKHAKHMSHFVEFIENHIGR